MTILSKDMGTELVVVGGGTAASGAYTSTSVDDVPLTSLVKASIDEPDYSMITEDGMLNADRATQPKGIYLATNSETSFIAATLVSYSGPQATTTMAWRFAQLMRNSALGTIIYTGGPRFCFVKWYGAHGLGLYCFVGYSAAELPSQTVEVGNSGAIYEAIWGANGYWATKAAEESAAEEAAKAGGTYVLETELKPEDIVGIAPGSAAEETNGYDGDTGLPFKVVGGLPTDGSPYFVTPTVSTKGKVTVTTTVPAQSASAGTETAPSYLQIVAALNRGWNTWARSINPLDQGDYLLFTAMAGIDSACLAIGPAGMEGRGIPAFSHSLIVDSEGLKVHENGVVVHTMKAGQNALSSLRIYRHSDNTIHYVITTGTETIVYKSLLDCPYPLIVSLYVYGHLYSSGDKVTAASFSTGEIHYGSV